MPGEIKKKETRPSARRPSRPIVAPLNSALEKGCPPDQWEAIIAAMAEKAANGDTSAARLLLSYNYGTPRSGDDLAIQERVNAIVLEFFCRLTPVYGVEKAREILGHLGSQPTGTGPSPPRLTAPKSKS